MCNNVWNGGYTKNVIDLVSIPIFWSHVNSNLALKKKLIQGYLVAKACYQLQHFKNYGACEKYCNTIVSDRRKT